MFSQTYNSPDNKSVNDRKKARSDYNSIFGKSLILIITCHGQIPIDNDNNYVECTVPPSMSVIKNSVATSGICNFTDPEYIDRTIYFINGHVDKLLNARNNTNDILKRCMTRLKDFSKAHIPELKNMPSNLKNKQDIDPDIIDYRHTFDNSFKIYNMDSMGIDVIADKMFLRFFKEKQGNDYSIVEISQPFPVDPHSDVLHVPELPDFFSRIFPPDKANPDDVQVLSMSDILDICVLEGINHLIIFDFSCSTYNKNGTTLTDREIRTIRRTNFNRVAGGK